MLSAASPQARVVDAGTRQPLEGAIVTAKWTLRCSGLGDTTLSGHAEIREAVTGQDGLFRFEAWGPKRVQALCEGDTARWPQLVVFHPGYIPVELVNRGNYTPGRRQSDHDGTVIRLEPFNGNDEGWRDELHGLQTCCSHLKGAAANGRKRRG